MGAAHAALQTCLNAHNYTNGTYAIFSAPDQRFHRDIAYRMCLVWDTASSMLGNAMLHNEHNTTDYNTLENSSLYPEAVLVT